MHAIRDRGYDRPQAFRFYFLAPTGSHQIGQVVETEHGPAPITKVGRDFSGKAYHYVGLDAEAIGAPLDHLTDEQKKTRDRMAPAKARAAATDATTRAATLEALSRDGWCSAKNVTAPQASRKRVFQALIEEGIIRLGSYRYELRKGVPVPGPATVEYEYGTDEYAIDAYGPMPTDAEFLSAVESLQAGGMPRPYVSDLPGFSPELQEWLYHRKIIKLDGVGPNARIVWGP